MAQSTASRKLFATCGNCEAVFVAERRPDGTIRPIGVPAECTCGDGEFEAVTHPTP